MRKDTRARLADAPSESDKRRDEILKRMLQTPPQPRTAKGKPKGQGTAIGHDECSGRLQALQPSPGVNAGAVQQRYEIAPVSDLHEFVAGQITTCAL